MVVLVVTKATKMLVAISVVANAVVGGSSSNSVAVAARINVVVAIGNILLDRRCKIVVAIIIIIAVMVVVLVLVVVVDAMIVVVACYFSFSAFLSIEAYSMFFVMASSLPCSTIHHCLVASRTSFFPIPVILASTFTDSITDCSLLQMQCFIVTQEQACFLSPVL